MAISQSKEADGQRQIVCPRCNNPVLFDEDWGSLYCKDCGINAGEVLRQQEVFRQRKGSKATKRRLQANEVSERNLGIKLDSDDVPRELRTWNWPAFIWVWIWCFGNRLPMWGMAHIVCSLFFFLPGLAITIYLGFNGHALAWKAGGYDRLEDYQASQRGWVIATWIWLAIVVFMIYLIIALLDFQRNVYGS